MALEEVKSMLRAVLMSCKEGVPAHILQRDYRELTQEPLPFKKLGFENLDDFILSMPDVVSVRKNRQGEVTFHAVASKETAHIQALVSKQRSTKRKRKLMPSRRRPAPRADAFKPPLIYGGRPAPPPRPMGGTRPPLLGQRPSPGTPHRRHGMPLLQYPFHSHHSHLQISKGSGPSRTVTVHSPQHKLMTCTITNTNSRGSEHDEQRGKRFEVPPRFRKLQGKENQPVSKPAPSQSVKRPVHHAVHPKEINYKKIQNGQKYMDTLVNYARHNDITLKFDTISMKVGKESGFASSIQIDGSVYGSGDVFSTIDDSEQAAAKAAVEDMDLQNEKVEKVSFSHSPASNKFLKSRIKELLKEKSNGIWNTRLSVMYKDKYKEEPPSDLMLIVKDWPDVVKIEENAATGRAILYPVTEVQTPTSTSQATVSTAADHQKTSSRVERLLSDVSSSQNVRSSAKPIKPQPVSREIKELRIQPAQPLPLGEKVKGYMTYLHHCNYFCIQREDSSIDDICKKMEHVSSNAIPEEEDLILGRFVAALYSEDNSWSRAEILDVIGTSVEVLFVDYGNQNRVFRSSTRFLSADLCSYPVQAIYCSLYGIAPLEGELDWSEDSMEKFAEYVKEEELILVTKEYTGDGICSVELYLSSDESISINEKLQQAGVVRKIEPQSQEIRNTEPAELQLPNDTQWDVYVSILNSSTNSVMIRLVGEQYSDKLEELERQLETAFHTASDVVEIKEGGIYIAYVEELFHRVRVLGNNGRKVECYFLDHGDIDSLIPDQLRPLEPAINKQLPYQALEVSMHGLEDISTNVTTLEKLFEIALGKTLVAEVNARDDGLSMVLFDTQGNEDININEEIIKAVQKEGETSLLTSSGSNPQSTESSPLPLRKSSELSQNSVESNIQTDSLMSQLPGSRLPKELSKTHEHVEITDNKQNIKHSVIPDKGVNTSKKPNISTCKKPDSAKKSVSFKEDLQETETDSWETESGEGSWETEEEEVIVDDSSVTKPVVKDTSKKCDAPKQSDNKNKSPKPNTSQSQKTIEKSKEPVKINTKSDSLESATKLTESSNSQKSNIYTWKKSESESLTLQDYENDEIALWDVNIYNKRPFPKKYEIPAIGNYCDVHITNVFDPTNFVCMPFEHFTDLDQLIRKLIEYYNTVEFTKELTMKELVLGQMYAGCKEGTWYRVTVRNHVSSDLVSVYLCDFGEWTVMSIDEIKLIPFQFTLLPIMAFKGKLHGIQPLRNRRVWSEAAKYKFREVALDKSLVALICDKPADDVISMRLVDTSQSNEDICIDEILLNMGFAEKIHS